MIAQGKAAATAFLSAFARTFPATSPVESQSDEALAFAVMGIQAAGKRLTSESGSGGTLLVRMRAPSDECYDGYQWMIFNTRSRCRLIAAARIDFRQGKPGRAA